MIDPKPTASHFINGAYIEDKTGTPIDVIYPATGAVIGRVHSATPQILQGSSCCGQSSSANMGGDDRYRARTDIAAGGGYDARPQPFFVRIGNL
jgi:betaine-aldehyde dehydrogenase